jgi:hypothetical protein
MRIWNSIAGWHPSSACAWFLIASVLLLLAWGKAFAKEKQKEDPLDLEMLEFLGTFETANGKMIDPLQFKEHPQLSNKTVKPAPNRKFSQKPEQQKKDVNDG